MTLSRLVRANRNNLIIHIVTVQAPTHTQDHRPLLKPCRYYAAAISRCSP